MVSTLYRFTPASACSRATSVRCFHPVPSAATSTTVSDRSITSGSSAYAGRRARCWRLRKRLERERSRDESGENTELQGRGLHGRTRYSRGQGGRPGLLQETDRSPGRVVAQRTLG